MRQCSASRVPARRVTGGVVATQQTDNPPASGVRARRSRYLLGVRRPRRADFRQLKGATRGGAVLVSTPLRLLPSSAARSGAPLTLRLSGGAHTAVSPASRIALSPPLNERSGRRALCPPTTVIESPHLPDACRRPLPYPQALFAPPKAIRGGIPICFPQFSDFGSLGQHGFARNKARRTRAGETRPS